MSSAEIAVPGPNCSSALVSSKTGTISPAGTADSQPEPVVAARPDSAVAHHHAAA